MNSVPLECARRIELPEKLLVFGQKVVLVENDLGHFGGRSELDDNV